jgi:3'-phosphoadenosine 5'-phosphosulfate sulfotransferase (PAPS reductase)/FAD synthetase
VIHQTRKQQEKTEVYYLASFSGGKDSTAMVLELIARGYPLDEVLCCDTTMEFPAMYRHIEKVRQVVEAAGVKFTMIKAENDFRYLMLEVKTKSGMSGRGWPTFKTRWCTGELKKDITRNHIATLKKQHEVIQYIGLAADEEYRLERKNNQNSSHRHPLVEWGWTEEECLNYCHAKGYDWGGLYEVFDRVSCWCCPLKSLKEMRKLRKCFPDLWEQLKDMDGRAWNQFRADYSVEDLEIRFQFEEERLAQGLSITNRDFHNKLKERLGRCAELREKVETSGI